MARLITVLVAFTSATAAARVGTGSSGGHFQTRMFDGQKYQAKEASQWTITDWLAQKSKMEWWDHWLAMNRSANIFEVNLSGGHGKYDFSVTDAAGAKSETASDAQVYRLDLNVTIFLLYGEYEKTSNHREAWGGAAGVRLFGNSSQTTSLLARYGWRKFNRLDTGEVWENQFAEGELQLYLFKYFGLQGRYRRIFRDKSHRGNFLEGSRATGGAFIDLGAIRVYGDFYREPLEFEDAAGVKTKEEREGYEAGLKLHF